MDSKIDSQDAAFSSLRIWKDADGDGYSSEGELLTLNEAGVQSISTGYTNSTLVDESGNAHKQTGTFTRTDGTTAAVTDVWFKTDNMYSIAEEWLEVPDDIAAMPNMKGYGQVRDLHQAMVRDSVLKGMVNQFMAEPSSAVRETYITGIIHRWTGVDGLAPDSRGTWIGDARKLYALEKFFGENFVQNGTSSDPWDGASRLLNQSYNGLFQLIFAELNAQTYLKPVFDLITYDISCFF